MITKVVNVDLHLPIYERLTAKQGDIASRFILFHLLDGDTPFDLTGKSVRVYARKPDKTEIFNDLIINDETKGYCTLELTSQCLAEAGIVKMELYISESDKVLTSIPFDLEVISCINNVNAIVSTNEFSALNAALESLQDFDSLKSEIVEARKGYGTLGERLDNIDSHGNAGSGLQKIVVKELITTPSLISVGDVVLSNGFYSECDMPPMFYKCKSLDNTENFADIGNGIFVGQDCSIKIDGTKKITPLSKDVVHVSQIGGIANNTNIRNEICINAILKNYIACSLGAGTYTIKGSIIHQSNSKLLGLGLDVTAIKMADGINKYPIKSHSCDLNSFTMLSNNLTLDGFTLDGNCSNNDARDYSGNVYKTYWGFGMMLCNIANLNISNVRCVNTEAWAISYWLCGTVIANNLEFYQDETRVGYNGDGITGSAKRVNISNVTGFTNDDMVGITTGMASLRGNACGVSVNIDIDYINVKNIYCMSKNDAKTYSGVGVYLDNGAKISKVTIDNVKGDYTSNAISIADYWTTDNLVDSKISSLSIKNVCVEHSYRGAIHILAVEIDDLEISDVIANGVDKDDLGVIELDYSKIKRLSASNITMLRTNACETSNVIKLTNNTTINTLKINGVIIDDGGNSPELRVIKGGRVNNIIYNNVYIDRTYLGNIILTDNTGFKLICDKMDINPNAIVPYGGVTINSISAKVIGNSLNIVLDASIQVSDLNANYDFLDLSMLDFLLDKTYITSANLGGQPSTDNKPIFAFSYDNANKKIILQMPSLNGSPAPGKLMVFTQMSIPLA